MLSLSQSWHRTFPRLGAMHWCGLSFLGYASASLLWSVEPNWPALSWLMLLTSFTICGWIVTSMHWLYLGVIVYMTLNVAIAFTQYLKWDWVDYATQYPAGLLINSNWLACAIAMAMVAALCIRHYWFLPIGAFGIYLTHSRGAIVSVGTAGLLYLWPRAKVSAFVVGVFAIILAIELSSGRSDSLAQRMGIWQGALTHLTLFGSGLGTFGDTYMALPMKINMTMMSTEHAYNDFLELLFELGLGAIPFWLMFILAMESELETERLILVSYIILALTYFPIFTPIAGPLAAIVLGHLSKGEVNGS